MQAQPKKQSLIKRAGKILKISGLMTLPPRVQYGALPWRMADGTLEVLLVTSRGTGRWVIPKGWPHDGLSSAQSAAQEAFEEAGIVGAVTEEPVGSFRYEKVRQEGDCVDCIVYVHALMVEQFLPSWPEKSQRQSQWFPRHIAAQNVAEAELGELILKYAPPLPYS